MFKRCSNNKKSWQNEVERIRDLKHRLESLGEFPSPANYRDAYPYAVDFFKLIAEFQDNGYISNAPENLKGLQKKFNEAIKNCGRSKYGVNRTAPGEEVTLDNTYWGNAFGIWTFTSRKFMCDCDNSNPPAALTISSFQVRPFVKSNMKILLELSDKLCS